MVSRKVVALRRNYELMIMTKNASIPEVSVMLPYT